MLKGKISNAHTSLIGACFNYNYKQGRWAQVRNRWYSSESQYREVIPAQGDRIYVAMSSGVDSSTVAAIMAQKYPGQVTGIYMANWSSTAKCTEADWNDVQKVCKSIGIPCNRVSFEKEYWTEVFMPMIEQYKAGLTPNPDVGCNRHIKFGALTDFISRNLTRHETGQSKWWLATGHYARTAMHSNSNQIHLLRPKHLHKDQTYYLSNILPDILPRILFPLAQYTKPEVRAMAMNFELSTASKPDSQGLCFVSQDHNNFRNFLSEYLPPNPGHIVTDSGKVVGTHQGIWHATVGQKSGISMPQGDPDCRGVWYVSNKDVKSNTITIVRGPNNPLLFSRSVSCTSFKFLANDILPEDIYNNLDHVYIQYRSLQEPVPVSKVQFSPATDCWNLTVEFQTPQRAVAPGQFLVAYMNDRLIGSGMIAKEFRTSTGPVLTKASKLTISPSAPQPMITI